MVDGAVEGVQVDPNRVAAAQLAVKQTASEFTYMGVKVGDYITDDECNKIAVAVLAALAAFDSAKSI